MRCSMNANGSASAARPAAHDDLLATIIQRYSLNSDDIARIKRLQETCFVSFVEAAVRLGYIPQEDVDSRSSARHLPRAVQTGATPAAELLIAHDLDHPRSEQIRSLRTELLQRHHSPYEANMLAVVSPGTREGRSQLAAELAIAFAQLGRPTLLVDADMRRPRQHELFQTENTHGLSEVLSGQEDAQFHEVSDLPALSLITAGPLRSNALELLSHRWFETLVDGWRERFEFVVFDTPPVNQYADGLAIATIVGHVLSLSRAKHTSYKDTRNLLQRLAATRSSVHGAVLNHF